MPDPADCIWTAPKYLLVQWDRPCYLAIIQAKFGKDHASVPVPLCKPLHCEAQHTRKALEKHFLTKYSETQTTSCQQQVADVFFCLDLE